MRKSYLILFPVFVLMLVLGCSREVEHPQVIVALSKGSPENSYAHYYNWVKSLDSNVIIREMYAMPMDSALELFRGCSGLILTGGTDINPALYGKASDSLRCQTKDGHRDSLELKLIESARALGIPILGICRGHQMLNVALGGTLIIDIPSDFDTAVAHRCNDFASCNHPVAIVAGSSLNGITGLLEGSVNSAHHQGIETLAPLLRIIAHSPDGLPEAVEWVDPSGKAFLLGVQWHPERLGSDNPLSKEIGLRFLEACRK